MELHLTIKLVMLFIVCISYNVPNILSLLARDLAWSISRIHTSQSRAHSPGRRLPHSHTHHQRQRSP